AQRGKAVHAQARIDHGVDLAAHAAGPDRVQIGDTAHADFRAYLFIALAGVARNHLLDDVGLERGLARDRAAQPGAVDERLEVVVRGQEVEADLGRSERIGTLDAHRAAA